MKQATGLISKAAFGLMSVAALASSVLAAADDYGYSYSYGSDLSGSDAAAASGIMALGGLWIVFVCCMVILGIAGLAFNIWMIVDVLKRTEAEMPNRQTWMILLIVGLVLGFGALVALVYFFGPRKKLGPAKK